MGLKILHSADWHLDTPFASFSESQRRDLHSQLLQIPGKIGEILQREQVDLVLLAGDLFDAKPSPRTLALVKQALRDYGVPVFISPGNHDYWDVGSVWEEDWPENVHIFPEGWSSVSLPELNCRVYGAGYGSMDCPAMLNHFQPQGQERYCIGVLHGDPVVKNSPCCPVTAVQVRESGFDYLALGHIHKAGAFRGGETLCAWPGCPMGRGWDETGEKGVCLVTLEDTAEVRWIPLDVIRFYDLEVRVGNDAAAAVEGVLPAAAGNDYYRVTLTGWGDVDMAALNARFGAYPNLQLRDRTRPAEPVWQEAGEDTLRGVYLRMLRDSEDPAAKLAAELSQQLLMGEEVPLP